MGDLKTPSWDDLRILLAVHRHQSFLAAGKSLGLAASTIARRIDALERDLGRPLVHRGNDGTRLDPDALRLVAMGEELELGLASLVRGGKEATVTGTVRVSLSEGFIRLVVQVLARLRAKHPSLAVELISESRVADLARREADIGVRIVRSSSPAIVSRPMGRAHAALFASRDYVDRRGVKMASAPLHDWVGFDSSLSHLPHEQWLRELGAKNFVFRSNSAIAIEQAVLAGMGIAILSDVQGAAMPTLVRLDAAKQPPPVDVFLAFHRDARKVPRVRVVVDALELELRRQLG